MRTYEGDADRLLVICLRDKCRRYSGKPVIQFFAEQFLEKRLVFVSQQKNILIDTWVSRCTESFVVEILVQTILGFRCVYYTPINTNGGIHATNAHYNHHGPGSGARYQAG